MEAPKGEAETLSASSQHRSWRVPEKLQATVNVVEVKGVDNLRHRSEDGDAVDVFLPHVETDGELCSDWVESNASDLHVFFPVHVARDDLLLHDIDQI